MSDQKTQSSDKGSSRGGIEKRGGYAAGDRKPIAEWNPPPQGPAPGATVNNGSGDGAEPSASSLPETSPDSTGDDRHGSSQV